MENSFSLYIHIPFCKKKCAYCDFFSRPCGEDGVPDEYISALIREAFFYSRKFNIKSWKTVYIGGGTPSILTSVQLEKLLAGIKSAAIFSPKAEISVEMNPDDISEELLSVLEKNGVNRISVGIQSLSDKVLDSVSRRCSRETSRKALALLSEKWKYGFSADLISGLPEDSIKTFQQTVEELISFNPDHISLYSLTLEENTPLGKAVNSGIIPYDYEKADDLWLYGRKILEERGYHQYEVSNFAKPFKESEHNKTYWHLQNYIGIGAGATGTLYSDGDEKKGFRWTDVQNIEQYCGFWNNNHSVVESAIPRDCEILDKATEEFEFLMMGFRLLEGINSAEYEKRFGRNLAERLGVEKGGLFEKWQNQNLARIYSNNGFEYYALTRNGILMLNPFLEELLI